MILLGKQRVTTYTGLVAQLEAIAGTAAGNIPTENVS